MDQSNEKNYLFSRGFEYAGHWHKDTNKLTFSLVRSWANHPVIYVFIDNNDQILYIGRTVLDLENAMNRIRRGNVSQGTNHRFHNHLLEHLKKSHSIEILSHTGTKDHTDLAAFFDEIKVELLQHTSPIWNVR